MYFITNWWKQRRIYPTVASLIFGLALSMPGLLVHSAETEANKMDADSLSLNKTVELALAGNPKLSEIKARAQAMVAVPSQEGALPDPTIRFGSLYLPTNSYNFHQDDFTMLELGISQEIPFPGKLDLREHIAEQEALAAANSVEEARLRLVRGETRLVALILLPTSFKITG